MPTELFEDFFWALADHGRLNLHLDLLRGRNSHHIAETLFKATARALAPPSPATPARPASRDQGLPVTIAIADYGIGNLGSVTKAFRHVGAEVMLSGDPEVLRRADALVLPGDGAFGATMAEVERRGLVPVLRDAAEARKPLLGICIGMQVLFEESEEHGRHAGLGLLQGAVRRFEGDSPCPTWAGTGSTPEGRTRFSRASRTAPTCTSSIPTTATRPRKRSWPRPTTAVSSRRSSGAAGSWGSSSTPRRARRSACAWSATSSAFVEGRAEGRVIVVPAVDVRRGRVVRLRQGQVGDETIYGTIPCWRRGAGRARARSGSTSSTSTPRSTGSPSPRRSGPSSMPLRIPVEVGGGVRTLWDARRYLEEHGVDRVIFGTAAVAHPEIVKQAVALWPAGVAVAIDARDGRTAVAGWNETTAVDALEFAAEVEGWGVPRVQYTDIARDGTLVGPNLAAIARLGRRTGLRITAAGGISTLDDLRRLAALGLPGLDEVIVGRALYDGCFTLADALAALGGPGEEG